jgi:hypothetical protein
MKTAFRKASDAARQISFVWKSKGSSAHARPYNRYQADEGKTWWSIPSAQWPAFSLGKFIASTEDYLSQPGQIFIGLYLEHGLGYKAGGNYPDDWFMDSDWTWHRFVSDLKAGSLREPISHAAKGIGQPISLIITAHVPAYKGKIHPPCDLVHYKTIDGSKLLLSDKAIPTRKFLIKCDSCNSVKKLAAQLDLIPDSEWVWIDLYIGYSFSCGSPADQSSLTAVQLWDKLLKFFVAWTG